MAFTHRVCVNERVGGECKQRFRITSAKRSGTGQHIGERKVESASRDGTVDLQGNITARQFDGTGEHIFEKCAKCAKPISLRRGLRRHGMTSPFEKKPFLHGPTDGAAEVDAGN